MQQEVLDILTIVVQCRLLGSPERKSLGLEGTSEYTFHALQGGDQMRKLAVFSVLVLALMATGVTPAHAAGPYCIVLTNFCDTLEVQTSGVNHYGLWDWTCDGVTLTPVIGVQSAGLITAASLRSGLGYATNFNFN